MATLYRDTGYSLTHLIEDIKHGNLALPDIQRPFVWSSAKTRDLFDSMYQGFPVGTLMFWETGADVGTRQVGGGDHDRVAKLLIVDGQQRLTSLFAVITGTPVLTKSFEEKRIRVGFRPADEMFEVTDAAIEKDPEFIPDEDFGDLFFVGSRVEFDNLEAKVAQISNSVDPLLEPVLLLLGELTPSTLGEPSHELSNL